MVNYKVAVNLPDLMELYSNLEVIMMMTTKIKEFILAYCIKYVKNSGFVILTQSELEEVRNGDQSMYFAYGGW